jgi:isoleucyl-tRNA synthetase
LTPLQANGLVHKEIIDHDYPFCWRCENPLIFLAVPQWFFKVTAIREKLLKHNKKTHWGPDWAGARFKNWLESLGDWPISRQRYWGIPLPIWECGKCNEIKVLASADELPRKLKDLHKPYIDEITFPCKKCKGLMKRVPDVMDVWFDAGVVTWASLGYPKEQKLFKKWWPTDLQIEGPDQFRGWWNAQAITGVITFDKYPFKHVLLHGFVLDAKGKSKMSKSKGGLSPEEFSQKYSRDVLRYFYLAEDHSMDFKFDWDKIAKMNRTLKLYANIVSFIETYCGKGNKLTGLKPEDQWIISRVNSVVDQMEHANKNLEYHKSTRAWENFVVNDLSKNYIKFIRERTRSSYTGKDKKAAFATLYYVLERINAVIAPVCPHLSEVVYRNVIMDKKSPESVHMSDWPHWNKKKVDKKLEDKMSVALQVIEAAASVRNTINLRLRQPLKELVIITTDGKITRAIKETTEIIKSQTNVKNVRWMTIPPKGDSYAKVVLDKMSVALDKTMDDSLLKEGRTREVIRRIQQMRKELGLKEKDGIDVNILEPLDIDEKAIKKITNTKKLHIGKKVLTGKEKVWDIGEMEITIIVKS